MSDSNSSRQGVQVISRAASILRTLERHTQGLSLGAIAKETGLARSTVQRIIYALETEGFVIAASPGGRVRLGPGLVSLGSAAKADIDRVILPHMKRLSEEVEETVDLSVQDGDMMIFIDQVTAQTQRLRAVSAVGNAFPIGRCANGKAVLANLPKEQAIQLLSLPGDQQSTGRPMQPLLDELESIRASGVAFDREEHLEGICAVGAAVDDPYGRNIALSIPVPAVRFYKNEERLAKKLLQYCTIIEAALGRS
ncbi:IclR family transcriptional regulator [Pseudomaricurvus alkylphenolicus]|jgi:DNA-binding IclR family transcriptional regulator|uniref:IclR family transcriptional regulator n=1 Tax=Pseudomaricurvus alkylphenolicus TaxID=1306991 RepID=UPI001422DEAC|nr:IclR family transcriptional regulator [Pseudomaricurvus alkylphenolicus]NIB40879.1 IclR family transcriptional regulator [Pseudomaricurvus alkylphenolicus]